MNTHEYTEEEDEAFEDIERRSKPIQLPSDAQPYTTPKDTPSESEGNKDVS